MTEIPILISQSTYNLHQPPQHAKLAPPFTYYPPLLSTPDNSSLPPDLRLCPPSFKTGGNWWLGRGKGIAYNDARNQHDSNRSLSIITAIFRTHNPLVPGSNPGGPTIFQKEKTLIGGAGLWR